MEYQREKREREDSFTNCESKEPDYKRLCDTKDVDVFEIPVKGKYSDKYGDFALCSAEDYEDISKYSWFWDTQGYAKTWIIETRKITQMSRFVMKAEKGTIVDHINRDRKDNRRNNLRFVTPSQNAQNKTKKDGGSSMYNGVSYDKRCNKFHAKMTFNGIYYHLGYFDKEIEAAKYYDTYITQNREKLGLCLELNFPDDIDSYKQLPIIVLKKRESRSEFRYVLKHKNKFEVSFVYEGKRVYLGLYETAELAAKIADSYIVQNNMDKKLNFPEEYPKFNPQKVCLYITEIDLTNDSICEILRNIGKHTELSDINPEKDILIQIGGNNKDKYTIIERADFESLKYYAMTLVQSGYVKLSKGTTNHSLSRFIFRDTVTKDEVVDHIFSNKLDNRKRFLKVVSVAQNNNNRRKPTGCSSKFSGVYKTKKNRYTISVINNGKRVFRKSMKDEFEAARLRDLFIIQNYPNDNYRLNFSDWDEKTINHWTNQLKEHIKWGKPIVESK